MLNIVIPMAGRGSRFSEAGYELPKPLIDVNGKHMIEVVINNLKPDCPHRFIFVCQQEHIEQFALNSIFEKACDNYEVIGIDGVTEGAAITVLKAEAFINNNDPLMIANSDQWIDADINQYLEDMTLRGLSGSMLTMKASDPKWSYAKVDSEGNVNEVVEKVVVSDEATVGIYNFSEGKLFCEFASYMIENNIRSNNEFYVAPVYSFMADSDYKIGVYNIGAERDGMYGLGIPDDLDFFLESTVLNKAISF